MKGLLSMLVFFLAFGVQAQAQIEEESYEEPVDELYVEPFDEPMTDDALLIDEPAQDPATDTSVGRIEGQAPQARSEWRDMVRVMPFAGAASYRPDEGADFDDLDEGFTTGLLLNIGQGFWSFETGLNYTTTNLETEPGAARTSVDYWGIPLVARMNFSGKPQETVFIKGGVVPLTIDTPTTDYFDDFDLIGQLGVGGEMPLSEQVSLVVDATYNQLLTREGLPTDYSGYHIMAGLSIAL